MTTRDFRITRVLPMPADEALPMHYPAAVRVEFQMIAGTDGAPVFYARELTPQEATRWGGALIAAANVVQGRALSEAALHLQLGLAADARDQFAALLREALDLVPRVDDDDPMVPALLEWCRRVRDVLPISTNATGG